jgi:hypothetical protein
VSPSGLVYLASVEGLLYALTSDGAYRWSYGLNGMPVGAPAVDPVGHVFVATTAQRLYAFKPDGQLSWSLDLPTRFATPPVWAAPGLVYYAGRDRNLYSVPAWGSAPRPHWLGDSAEGELGSLAEGAIGVALATPAVQVFRHASPLGRIDLAASPTQALLGGTTHWYAVTRVGLAALDASTGAPAWTAPARRAGLSADERALVLEADGELVWREPVTGGELHRVQLSAQTSAPPVVTNSGIALVPLVSGRVLVIDPKAGRAAQVPVAAAPARAPVWNEASRRLTAAAGGDVVGVDLSDWVAPRRSDPRDSEATSDGATSEPPSDGGQASPSAAPPTSQRGSSWPTDAGSAHGGA